MHARAGSPCRTGPGKSWDIPSFDPQMNSSFIRPSQWCRLIKVIGGFLKRNVCVFVCCLLTSPPVFGLVCFVPPTELSFFFYASLPCSSCCVHFAGVAAILCLHGLTEIYSLYLKYFTFSTNINTSFFYLL